MKTRAGSVAFVLLASMAVNSLPAGPLVPYAAAQPAPGADQGAPQETTPSVPMPDVGGPATPPPPQALPPALPSALPPALPPTEAPAPVGAPDSQTPLATRAQSRQVTFTLHQLGAQGPLSLRGGSDLSGVKFGIRQDEVVTAASLKLGGATSPALLPQFSNVTVSLNEQYVGTIPVTHEKPRFENLEMAIDPVFFALDNRLNFRLSGRYTEKCNDPLSGLIWSNIDETSTLTLTLVRLPPQRDLTNLPRPFFDAHDLQPVVLPFVVTSSASNEVLRASGIVASWFGELANARGASFPTSATIPASGNAVVLATTDSLPPGLGSPAINGPTIAVLANPNDPASSVLLVTGRNGDELVAAAQALVVGDRVLGGETATVAAPTLYPRKPYDAPAWVPTDRPIKFGQLVAGSELQASGYTPGPLRVPFRTAPDLYTWRQRGFPAEIHYRGPPGPIVDLSFSRLDLGINDRYLASMPLADYAGKSDSWLPDMLRSKDVRELLSSGDVSTVKNVTVPVYDVFGRNELQLTFDTRPLDRGACVGVPGNLHMSVDPDSTIDLSHAYRIATLPNLSFFENSGFPFSRMADLSETAVILSRQADLREVQAYLELVGRIGSLTGYPALGMVVIRPDETSRVSDRDLLMVGTTDDLRAAADLLRASPFELEGQKIRISLNAPLDNVRRFFGIADDDRVGPAREALDATPPSTLVAMIGAESPLSHSRSLVAVVAGSREALQGMVSGLRDRELASKIQGDLAILSDGRPTSYRVGGTYTVGTLPWWLYPSFMLQDSPGGLLVALLIGIGLLGLVFYRALRRRAAARMRQIEPEGRS